MCDQNALVGNVGAFHALEIGFQEGAAEVAVLVGGEDGDGVDG